MVKLNSRNLECSTANEHFKAAFLNQPIIKSDFDSNIKTMSNIIYAYFLDRHGFANSFPDRNNSIHPRYSNASMMDLKTRLKQLKLNKGDMDELSLVSGYLHSKFRQHYLFVRSNSLSRPAHASLNLLLDNVVCSENKHPILH